MPYNGTGTFTRIYTWVVDRNNGIPITASRFDAEDDDFAGGFNLAMTRDGQGAPMADIPWGNHKITGLADPVNPQDAANWRSVTNYADTYFMPIAGGNVSGNFSASGTITSGGNMTAYGNFNTNQINGTTIVASSSFQCSPASGGAWYYATTPGVRQWQFGSQTDGTFWIFDASGSHAVVVFDTAGNTTVEGSETIVGNLQVNGAANVSGGITGAALQVNGAAGIASANGTLTLTSNGVRAWYIGAINNGQFWFADQSAAIVTATIGNGNGVWTFNYPTVCGSNLTINGAISCTTINTNANNITCGSLNVSSPTSVGGNGVTTTITGSTISWHWAANFVTVWDGGVNRGTITVTPSDERMKQNIRPVEEDILAQLRKLELISYDMPDFGGHVSAGFSAQQVGRIIPEALHRSIRVPYDGDRAYDEDEVFYSYDTTALLARCVGAIQQLAARIEALEARR